MPLFVAPMVLNGVICANCDNLKCGGNAVIAHVFKI